MRIGLIDVDHHNYPNLALMKISAFHKKQGDEVEWYMPFSDRYDRVYVSKVFSFTPDINEHINADEVIKGGTGYAIEYENGKEIYKSSLDKPLSNEIEHIYPDYSLYPMYCKDTAYGFLTRGCPRGCAFCHVAPKEGQRSVKVADLSEFWRGQKNIVLNDPNILACKDWRELFEQLSQSKANIDFNQGLDIRLMTEEKAQAIDSIKYKEIHFAWDKYEDKDLVLPKLKLFASVSKTKPRNKECVVYVLVNHTSTLEQDFERIYTIRDNGYWPFVMIYDKEHCKPIYKQIARWVNNRFIFAKCLDFTDYIKL